MNYSELLIIVAGFVLSFIIGLSTGYLIKALAPTATDEQTTATLRQEVADWERWYGEHMPQCAVLQHSNTAGYVLLEELEMMS